MRMRGIVSTGSTIAALVLLAGLGSVHWQEVQAQS